MLPLALGRYRRGSGTRELREALAESQRLEKVLGDEREAQPRGPNGVPTLVVAVPGGRELVLRGGQPHEALRESVERAAAQP